MEAVVDKDNACLRVVDILNIFGIGKERNGAGCSIFNLREGMHHGILVSFHTALNELGYLFSRKFHSIIAITFR